MELTPLTAISPVDGRYAKKTQHLRELFSEFALIRQRMHIELAWFVEVLVNIRGYEIDKDGFIADIMDGFCVEEAEEVKAIEDKVKHDVKALEYFLRNALQTTSLEQKDVPLLHFACTSEDITNLAYGMLLTKARETEILPTWSVIIDTIMDLAVQYSSQPMLSRTHLQPATPTTLGKELYVFCHRLRRQYERMEQVQILGKMNGTVGNYNAHTFVVPDVNWPELCQRFVEDLGLTWNPITTQIESQDYMVEYFSIISSFNSIVIDFCADIRGYISLEYLVLKKKEQEVGSSIMPHKVNPIDFENAEGNLKFANALLMFFQTVLPISQFQRDLTNSTILRNIGVGIAHGVIAYHSLLVGLSRLSVNVEVINNDLKDRWELLAEPIQTMLRFYGIDDAYEQLKELTRGVKLKREQLHDFITGLEIPDEGKERLLLLTPLTYIGLADELVS